MDFSGGPVVNTSPSNEGSEGSIPGGGPKIPHASGPKKEKQYCDKFNTDFKNGPNQLKKKVLGASFVLLKWLWVGSRMGAGHQKNQVTLETMNFPTSLHLPVREEGLEMELIIGHDYLRGLHTLQQ